VEPIVAARIYVTRGSEAVHDQLGLGTYHVTAFAPLAHKQAVARLQLSSAPIQTNSQRAVPCSQRAHDTEHHLLFKFSAVEKVRALFWGDLGLDLMGEVTNLTGLRMDLTCTNLQKSWHQVR
jgi:hypothetical protein